MEFLGLKFVFKNGNSENGQKLEILSFVKKKKKKNTINFLKGIPE